MKILILPLIGGSEATFFLNTNNLVVIDSKDKKTCTICDGIHNNGGWKIAKSYDEVVKEITRIFE
jgi:hypothetical protein